MLFTSISALFVHNHNSSSHIKTHIPINVIKIDEEKKTEKQRERYIRDDRYA